MTSVNGSPDFSPVPGAPVDAETPGLRGAAENVSKENDSFSADYVKELRRENAHFRTRAKEQEEAAQRAFKEAQALAAEVRRQAEAQVVRAELKAMALKAGMFDLDGLKLADLSQVRLEEDGSLVGADTLLTQLKQSKPYLFASPLSSSTHTGKAPNPDGVKPRRASEMTAEEYAAARAAAVRGGW